MKDSINQLIILIFWGCGAICVYFSSYAVAQSLSQDSAGQIFLLQAIVTTLALVSCFGLNSYLPKLIGGVDTILAVLCEVRVIFLLTMAFSLLLSIIVIFYYFFILSYSIDKIYVSFIIATCIISHSVMVVFSAIFQSLRKPNYSVFYLSICQQSFFGGGIYLFNLNEYYEVLICLCVSYVITLLISFFHLFITERILFSSGKEIEYSSGCNKVFDVIPSFFFILLLSVAINQVPLILSSSIMGMTSVAAFQVALKLSGLVSIVVTAVNTLVAPVCASLYTRNDHVSLKKLYLNSTLFIILITLPVICVLYLFSGYFMALFGEGYSDYYMFLKVLLIGQIFNVLTGPVACFLTMMGFYKNIIYSNLINAIIISFGYFFSLYSESEIYYTFTISIGLAISNIFMFLFFISKIKVIDGR
ncbi:MATE family efflux transporter [Vibrio cholerae]|nr:MATE family efflux transporter [Vibrio cholerae]